MPLRFDGAINLPTIAAGIGVVVTFATGLAVADTRISALEERTRSGPERLAAIEATIAVNNKQLETLSTKIDALSTKIDSLPRR